MTRVTMCLAALCISLSACATNFTGSAHIEGGRAACEQKCSGQGLAMTGLVYMGEYSSACVCSVPGSNNSAGSASVAAGAAGVVMQMRNNESRGGSAGFRIN